MAVSLALADETRLREPALSAEDAVMVSPERLTRFYLANHFLLHNAGRQHVVDVAGVVCGLHSQLPLTPHFSLWNRVSDFRPEMLDRALYREKSLVKTWFMRGTLHIISAKDLPLYHNALKRMWFEHHGRFMENPRWPSAEAREKLLYPKIAEVLAEKPLRRKELSERVHVLLGKKEQRYAGLFSAWGGILKETSYLGLTVYGEPCGKETCFARLDRWLPNINIDCVNEDKAREELLLKYLHCYGPASAQDFACWSGLLTSEAKKAIEERTADLVQVQRQNNKKSLWMLKKDLSILQKLDLEERPPLRLLPKFDSYLLGHKDRTRIIDEVFLKQVFRPVVGEVAATVLINGHIVGTWTHKKTKGKLEIAIKPFRKYDRETVDELGQVAKELGILMSAKETTVLLNAESM